MGWQESPSSAPVALRRLQVRALLAGRPAAATHHELLHDWPADREKPSPNTLDLWLNRATEENLVVREGKGTRLNPYRYRLADAEDDD